MQFVLLWLAIVVPAAIGIAVDWSFWLGFGVLAVAMLAISLLAGWRPSRPRVRNDITGLGLLAACVGGAIVELAERCPRRRRPIT